MDHFLLEPVKGNRRILNRTPSKSKLKGTQNILTPCFNIAASLPSQLAPDPESYDSNPLGEIRATAREFVPTHFTPAPLNVHSNESIAVHAASLSAQSAPPGLVVDSPITESGKNQATSLLVPPSILESNNAFDRSISAISAVSSKPNGGSSIWGGSSGFSTFNFGDGTVNTNTNIQ